MVIENGDGIMTDNPTDFSGIEQRGYRAIGKSLHIDVDDIKQMLTNRIEELEDIKSKMEDRMKTVSIPNDGVRTIIIEKRIEENRRYLESLE